MRKSATWALALAAATLLAGAALAPDAAAKASGRDREDLEEAHARGLAFLAQQGGEGPYPPGLAAYAVEAAHAGGLDPASWPEPSRAALDSVAVPPANGSYLSLVRPAYTLALAGRLGDWRGEDIGARLRADFDGTQSGDPALLNDDLYAGFALVAAGVGPDDPQVAAVAELLRSQQGEDGGWGYAVGGRSAVDTTAMAVLFLQRSQADDPAFDPVFDRAVGFILSAQDETTHGFGEEPGHGPNCDSTAWALRVYLRGDGVAGWTYLLGLQGADGGFAYQAGQPSNALCTAEAVTVLGDALQGRTDVLAQDTAFNESPALPVGVAAAALLLMVRRFRRS